MIVRIEDSDIQDSIQKNRVKRLEDNLYEIRLIGTDKKLIRSIYFQLKQNQYHIVSGFIKKRIKPHLEKSKKQKKEEIRR